MLRSRIIPCLLLHRRGLVKTRQFGDPKYVGDPLNAVKIFNEKEVDEILFCDIDASSEGRTPDMGLLREIAVESRMPMCFGGGVHSAGLAERIINIGFEKVSLSSGAIERPELISEVAKTIGSQSVVLTIDYRQPRFIGGPTVWTLNGTKKQPTKLLEFCKRAVDCGAGEIVLNSIDRDGMQGGYDLGLASEVAASVRVPLTVLGGAGSLNHLQELIDSVGTVGAAAGSLFVFKGQFRAVLINYERPSRI